MAQPLVFSNLLSAEEWQAARWLLVRDDGDRLFAYDGYPTLEQAQAEMTISKAKFPALDWSVYHIMEKDNLDGRIEIEPALRTATTESAT